MEIGARATLERKDIAPEIMKYCDEGARMGGGSDSLLDNCIAMEQEGRDAMRSN